MSLPPTDGGDDWFLDCGILEDLPAAACGAFPWDASVSSSNPSAEVGSHVNKLDLPKDSGSNKRLRSEPCGRPTSKACREKVRRDKLNDSDATRMVTQLRAEAQQLKDTNGSLEDKIKELKAEKDELRDEKQKLKLEKETLAHQMKLLTATPAYMPHPTMMPSPFAQAPMAPFHAQGQALGQKLMMPFVGYPGYPMWQLMPPSEVDTSKDSEACPPVA
ncbi:unnamed protein product [Triticum turgidum subsp. durum]|uniref:Uncharacterized protein n=1 Tax=Triticum turgidum subsp. durum TaxID=4567 RepID=A0A9R0ZFT6_TRITD|nr:unnamed protein product [Triticum turgidum subsp. durum]